MSERPSFRVVETDGAQPDDDRLMAVLATGEMAPLAELYTRYGKVVRATILRFAPEISGAEAEELGQDAFLALAQTAARYEPGKRLKAWLVGIAVNKARGWRRATWLRRKLLKRHHRDPVGVFAVRDAQPDRDAENRDELRRALEMLPAAQREVLLLNVVEGFTGEEIAQILGIRPKTVWTRLHRARKALTRSLARGETARDREEEETR